MTSLMVDLKSIDLGPIEAARAAINGALANPELQKLLSGDAFETALGSLGSAMGSLKTSTPDAAKLLQPLADAAQSLLQNINPSSVPIAKYAQAVSDGAGIVVQLVSVLQSDPSSLGKLLSLDRLTKAVSELNVGYSQGDSIGRLREVIRRVESGVPSTPQELAELAVDVLLPFGARNVKSIRGGVDIVFSASASIALPRGRLGGLLLALDAVEAAAARPEQLAQALANLERIRRSTIAILTTDLHDIRDAIARLSIAEKLAPLASFAATIRAGEDGFLELLDRWREMLEHAREQVEEFDVDQLRTLLDALTTFVDEQAHLRIEKPIDESVAIAEEFVRGLFRRLGLRTFRAQITGFLASIAQGIESAHLDQAAKEIHGAIAAVDHALDPATLAAEIQLLLGDVKEQIESVVNSVKTALEGVVNAIQTVEATLQSTLQRVADILDGFAEAMKAIGDAVDALDIEGATEQTIAAIHSLRDAATKLLSVAPLPEPLRPMVEQVITALESFDTETLFLPVRAVTAQIKVPDEVKAQITEALKEVKAKLDNAIPAQLIASIDAEVKKALDTIRKFDPDKLLDGVRAYLVEAATFLESLDVKSAAEEIRGPFQAVLDAIDAVAPRKLLAPAISTYDSLIGRLSVPSVAEAVDKFAAVINTAGESATQQLLAPIAQLTGTTPNVSGGAPGAAASTPTATDTALAAAATVKPGDVIRLLGWLPNKLREAIRELPATVAGDVIGSIDAITSGLARDIRAIRRRVLDVTARIESQLDADLRLVADAQIRAQLAVRLHAAPGVDVNVSLTAIGNVSAGQLRRELGAALNDMHDRAGHELTALGGTTAVALEQAATALESFQLARVARSVDQLLAALDPEPIAAEVDALAVAVLKKAPDILEEVEADLIAAVTKLRRTFDDLNPATQAQKFLRVLEVLRQELDILNPGILADELGGIHLAVRNAVAAYDPRGIAAEVSATLEHVAQSLRTLNVSTLLGDLDFFAPIVAAVEQANPATVLQNVGTSLKEVGDRIAAVDPAKMLEQVEQLVPRIEKAFEAAVKQIIDEIEALLKAIKYASGNASVSVSATVTT